MTATMATFVAAFNRQSAARANHRRLWVLACEHDKISPSAKFVVFSDGNPHTAELNRAGAELLAAIQAIGGGAR